MYFLKTVNNQFDTVQLFTEYETYHASKFFSDQPGIAAQPISSIFEIDGIDRRSDFRFMFNVTAKDKQIVPPSVMLPTVPISALLPIGRSIGSPDHIVGEKSPKYRECQRGAA